MGTFLNDIHEESLNKPCQCNNYGTVKSDYRICPKSNYRIPECIALGNPYNHTRENPLVWCNCARIHLYIMLHSLQRHRQCNLATLYIYAMYPLIIIIFISCNHWWQKRQGFQSHWRCRWSAYKYDTSGMVMLVTTCNNHIEQFVGYHSLKL